MTMFVTPGYAATTEAPAAGRTKATPKPAPSMVAATALFRRSTRRTFPSQLLWLAIIFGLFYLFLKRVALPRVGSILEVRSQRIAQDLDQAATHEGGGRRRGRRLRAGTRRGARQGQCDRPGGEQRRQGRGRDQAQAGRGRAREASSPRPRRGSPRSSRRRWPRSARLRPTPPRRSSSG